MLKKILACFVIMMAGSVCAQSTLQYTYQPNKTYLLVLSPLVVTQIQLEGISQIDSISCGDPLSWEIKTDSVHHNRLIVKPKVTYSFTNMIISSGERTYFFRLIVDAAMHSDPVYSVRVVSPSRHLRRAKKSKSIPALTSKKQVVLVYRGDPSLRPQWAFSRGNRVYLKWSDSVFFPAIYRYREGSGYLVNFRIKHGVMMVPFKTDCLVLRRGSYVGSLSLKEVKR